MEKIGDLVIFAMIQFVVTWMMVGIMWFSQIVHYPLYKKIREGFIEYERSHIRLAAVLLGPMMLIEVITAIIMIGMAEEGLLTQLAGANLLLLAVLWIFTLLFQVNQHQKLSIHFSKNILRRLIYSNWIRTLLWTVKGGVMVAFVVELIA